MTKGLSDTDLQSLLTTTMACFALTLCMHCDLATVTHGFIMRDQETRSKKLSKCKKWCYKWRSQNPKISQCDFFPIFSDIALFLMPLTIHGNTSVLVQVHQLTTSRPKH